MKILHLVKGYPASNSFVPDQENFYGCLDIPPKAVLENKGVQLPSAKFEIKDIVAAMPWKPDYISISSSLAITGSPPIPLNIGSLGVPTVMKLTDSHHMAKPIRRLIEYSEKVNCDYHWTSYNRNHIHFFREAKLKNVFWMPGAINISLEEVERDDREYDVLFCGSIEYIHPIRRELLMYVKEKGILVTIERKSYHDSLKAYKSAKIVFNCSLNGDLNRRVYEVLMAGGFLLTDRLSTQSGLFELFKEGEHIECYGSKEELYEKIRFYLQNPQKSALIAAQGHKKFLEICHPGILFQKFENYVNGGILDPVFQSQAIVENNTTSSDEQNKLKERLQIYELLQELQRLNLKLKVLYQGNCTSFVKDVSDLYRISFFLKKELKAYNKNDINFTICPDDLDGANFDIIIADESATVTSLLDSIYLLVDGGFLIAPNKILFGINKMHLYLRHGIVKAQLLEGATKEAIDIDNYVIFVKRPFSSNSRIRSNFIEQYPKMIRILRKVMKRLKKLLR